MKVTITFDTDDDAQEVLAMVGRVLDAPAGGTVADKPKADKKETATAKKKREAAEAEAAEAEKADETPDGPSRDDVRTKLKEYAALEGKDAAIGILKDHGAASIGELDEDKFEEVIKACE